MNVQPATQESSYYNKIKASIETFDKSIFDRWEKSIAESLELGGITSYIYDIPDWPTGQSIYQQEKSFATLINEPNPGVDVILQIKDDVLEEGLAFPADSYPRPRVEVKRKKTHRKKKSGEKGKTPPKKTMAR